MQDAEQAFDLYRRLINTHDFSRLEEQVVDTAITCVFGQDIYRGRDAVRAAFERAWNDLPDERYQMSNPEWIVRASDLAVALFDYKYEGTAQTGKRVMGGGRGTNIYRRTDAGWRLVHEHLSPATGDCQG